MDKTYEYLRSSALFSGMSAEESAALCACLGGRRQTYPARAILLHAGDVTDRLGLLLSGSLHIVQEDWAGNATIVSRVQPGEPFAEAFACGGGPLSVMVQAAEDAEVLWMEVGQLMQPCERACPAHRKAMANLVRLLAQKTVFLTGRIAHLAHRRLREKLLSYLAEQARQQGSRRIRIPFSRQELADYLSADRSALSAVLCRLRDEGVLTFRKNEFTLL